MANKETPDLAVVRQWLDNQGREIEQKQQEAELESQRIEIALSSPKQIWRLNPKILKGIENTRESSQSPTRFLWQLSFSWRLHSWGTH